MKSMAQLLQEQQDIQTKLNLLNSGNSSSFSATEDLQRQLEETSVAIQLAQASVEPMNNVAPPPPPPAPKHSLVLPDATSPTLAYFFSASFLS